MDAKAESLIINSAGQRLGVEMRITTNCALKAQINE